MSNTSVRFIGNRPYQNTFGRPEPPKSKPEIPSGMQAKNASSGLLLMLASRLGAQIVFEQLTAVGGTQLIDSLVFDLPDTLARETKLIADILQ